MNIRVVYTKGKTNLQKVYAQEIIIETIRIYAQIYRSVFGEKINPIKCCLVEKLFSFTRYYKDNEYSFIFQWNGTHLSNQTIDACIYFILLEQTLLDDEGHPIRFRAHNFRFGFAGYLRQKGVPLERIATLLHHVNILVTDYYSCEPDEIILQQLYSVIDEIGGELRVESGVIRSIDDIRRFEQDCLKRFGALRKVPGGKCGVFCSCEAEYMCSQCECFIPQPEKRQEIVAKICNAEKLIRCGGPI